jgi:alpha-galactosidase
MAIRTALSLAAAASCASALNVPYYGTSANGFTSPPRGWNSDGLQALQNSSLFTYSQQGIAMQCGKLNVSAGYTLCSVDSGWSGDGGDSYGDSYGRIVPNTSLFPNMTQLADQLHSEGKLLGLYILPGALSADANVTVKGTDIRLGTLFDPTQQSYSLRNAFDFSKDGVQQWHNSVIQYFKTM